MIVTPRDFWAEAALGRLPAYDSISKYGYNSDIDTAAVEDVWSGGGLYTGFPTGSAEVVTVVSDSVNDTAAGTGARTVYIEGLDAQYNAQTETLTMNGTTKVDSAYTWVRVHRAYVATAGSNTNNVGAITVQHKITTANIFAVVTANTGVSYAAVYTIPAGYRGLISYVEVMMDKTTTATALGAIYQRPYGGAVRLTYPFAVSTDGEHVRHYNPGMVVLSKTDIAVRITGVSANNTPVYAHLEVHLHQP